MATVAQRPLSSSGILLTSNPFAAGPSSASSSSSSPAPSALGSDSSASSSTSLSDLPAFKRSNSSGNPPRPQSRPSTARRIRFAPLPDPRRAVVITDDGTELPIADDTHFPAAASLAVLEQCANGNFQPPNGTPPFEPPQDESNSSLNSSLNSTSTATPAHSSPASSVGSSPISHNASLPTPKSSTPLQPSNNSTPTSPPSSWSKPKTRSLLHPFKRSSAPSSSGSSSHSLTPTPSIDKDAPPPTKKKPISTEEILTLGTINLFRTTSRESTNKDNRENDSSSTLGWGLSRWTSTGSTATNNTVLSGSSPLARTQSTQSYKSKSKKSMSLFSSSGSSSSSSLSSDAKNSPRPGTAPKTRHKGTRMLNGRVYGAKRPSGNGPNLFASARDDEPEFVEWGYGGMGSVKGAKSAGVAAGNGAVNWSRLAGGDAASGSKDEDEDDGSGIAWAKKRREQREKKAKEEKERAEREKAEAEAAAEAASGDVEEAVGPKSESTMSTPTPTRHSTMDGVVASSTSPSPANELVSPSEKSQVLSEEPSTMIDEQPKIGISEASPGPSQDPLENLRLANGLPTPNASFLNAAAAYNGATTPSVSSELTPTFERYQMLTPTASGHTQSPLSTSTIATSASTNGAPVPPTPVSATPSAAPHGRKEEQHVLTAINVPVNVHRRHHSAGHAHRRNVSKGSIVGPEDEKEGKEKEVVLDSVAEDPVGPASDGVSVVVDGKEEIGVLATNGLANASPTKFTTRPRPRSGSVASDVSSSSASTESEDDDEERRSPDEDDEDDDEEEEEDEEEERRRKTALGAGVEKVSRHKE